MEHNTIRILHFADVHFGMENYGKIDPVTGLNTRLLDFQRAFQRIVDYAIGKNPKPVDLVLFAGDAYKTREPTPTHQRFFAQGIREIASADIPVVMIVGNHDLPGAIGKSHTLDVFKTLRVPNVHITDKPELIEVDQIQIACLPWLTRSQFLTNQDTKRLTHEQINRFITDKIRELVHDFDRKVDPNQPAILMAHGTVEGANFGSERIVELGTDIIIPLDTIKQSKFHYMALGHIHKHQEIIKQPMVMYSGSIERIDFGESTEDKGFMEIQFDKTGDAWHLNHNATKFRSTHPRRFETIPVTITDIDPDPTATVVSTIEHHKITDAVVKVIIHCSLAKSGEIREGPIREALREASFVAVITKQVTERDRVQIKDGYSDELTSLQPIDLLEKFFKTKQKPSSRIKKLKLYAQVLMDEAISE